MTKYIWLIPLFPLLGVIANGLLGKKLPKKLLGAFSCLTVLTSFLVSCCVVAHLAGMAPEARMITNRVFPWIVSGNLSVWFSVTLDPLSSVMILVVTGVGFLIHIYSLGYMSHDPGYTRFFAYLNLFTASMLILVLGDSFLLLFVGWELVGLCSYLLIGFWFEKPSAANAGKKAFIVNRVGDFGVVAAMLAIFGVFGTLDFQKIFSVIHHNEIVTPWFSGVPAPVLTVLSHSTPVFGVTLITAITLALFLGATGKSAQIPLYVWLPDAMEGPTPVSALIHAATMVTAGVYMVARCSIMFALAPMTLTVIALIGALTAVFAATIGMAQYDIKKVLAYSTISQLGYMFLACGVGAYGVAICHLMTHAFFKALLFLGSGSVIHGMHGEQDMRKMGALRTKMKITYATFMVATLAITGIPFFSGFFSKDEILWKAFAVPYGCAYYGKTLWVLGAGAALMTAFYMFRLVYMTFFGDKRWEDGVHPHESPVTMWLPLAVLAVLSVVGGWASTPKPWPLWHNESFYVWLEPVFANAHHILLSGLAHPTHPNEALEPVFMWVSVGIAIVGIFAATVLYLWTNAHEQIRKALAPLHTLLNGKYFVDEIYTCLIVEPGKWISSLFLWKFVDAVIIDGTVNLCGWIVKQCGGIIRRVQTGMVFNYALVFVMGVLLLIYFLVFSGA